MKEFKFLKQRSVYNPMYKKIISDYGPTVHLGNHCLNELMIRMLPHNFYCFCKIDFDNRNFFFLLYQCKKFVYTLWPHPFSGDHDFNKFESTLPYDTSTKVSKFVANVLWKFFIKCQHFSNFLIIFPCMICGLSYKNINFLYRRIVCANFSWICSTSACDFLAGL